MGGFDAVSIAHRVKKSFPDAKIVCMVRNQIEMIPSIYKQIVGEGYPGTIKDMMNQNRWRPVGFDLSQFEYHKLMSLYQELMGKEKVCVLQYELMRNDMRVFLGHLCGFMGIEVAELPAEDTVPRRYDPRHIRATGFHRPPGSTGADTAG